MAAVLAAFGFSQASREGENPCGKYGGCDRDVRGSIAAVPWDENSHVRSPGREAVEFELRAGMTIRRSGLRAS